MKIVRKLLVVAAVSWAILTTASTGAAIQTVSNVNDSGPGSLRQAINDANQNPGPDTIVFNIPVNSPGFNGTVFTINPLSALPPLTGANTTIDGATQTAFTGNTNPSGPEVVLNGSQVGYVGGGLAINSSGNIIRSLVLNGFNNTGIYITGAGATSNTVTGCYLGTNPTGNSAVPNTFDGLAITGGASNNTIGGSSPSERNLISGNARGGITIQDITVGSGANNNVVRGNFIGTNATGQSALGNGQWGVQIGPAASGNLVGGTTSEARNVISGNGGFGVALIQGNDIVNNRIQGNFIGTDVTGTLSVGNRGPGGVGLFSTSPNTIGGTASGAQNVISGNLSSGIHCNGCQNQVIQGNLISTNTNTGVILFSQLNNALNNAILSNSIFNNGGLGIDLGGNGVTRNDPCDIDTGPNNLQNYPVLTSITTSGGNVHIVGTLNSAANTTFRLEFFGDDVVDPSGFGEGRFFLGSSNVTTDGSCNASFDLNFPLVPGAGRITATATDPNGNTSEFSALPVITSPLVATGTVGLSFLYQFEASGATSLGVTNLPSGLTFNASLRTIIGLPTTEGIFQVGLSASNTAGTTTATLIVTVQPTPISGPVIISSTAATGRTGRAFSFQLQTSGGSSATHFTVDSLPPGFNLDPSTGFISGTPTSDGNFSLAVSAIDGAAITHATLQLTFTSAPTVPIITSAASAILTPGQFFTYTITADANGTFGYIGTDGIAHPGPSPSCAGLPAGLCFDGNHTISGTFNPPFGHDAGPRGILGLSGGIVTNVQLFAIGDGGTGTFPLINFIAAKGTIQISTRMAVGTGDNVLIGGFIINGTGTTRALIRAIGPSLTPLFPNALQDSTLELRDGAGLLLGSNDNWRDSQENAINALVTPTIAPRDNLESAILAFLSPGPYTAIVRGKNNTTGIALVEVYDLGVAAPVPPDNARLANISTRGTVLTGDNVIIGGFFIHPQAPATSTRVVIRAIGPSLPVPGALGDPTLELHDGNGALIDANDNWRSDHEAEIIATTIPPSNDLESAIVRDLTPGSYTAIVRGKDNTTGVALVEVYALE